MTDLDILMCQFAMLTVSGREQFETAAKRSVRPIQRLSHY